MGVEGSSKSICVRRFSNSALSLFRFHFSPFPPETPDTQAIILEAEKSGFINVGPILFLAFINGGPTKLQTGQKAKLV